MVDMPAKRFAVKNIDCASCAAKIEQGLNAMDGVDEAVLDFANQTLYVKAKDIARVLEEVKRLEPSVDLVPKFGNKTPDVQDKKAGDFKFKREFSLLIAAFALFILQLFFESWFHKQSFAHLEIVFVFTAYFLAGWNVFVGALRTIRRGIFFDENVLMVIATGGAIAIHAYSEAVGVMIFYKIGELLQGLAVSRSRRSIKSLLSVRPDKAVIKTTDGDIETKPESVRIGDLILVKPGERIPLDGEIVTGSSQIDSSALTGEFIPKTAGPGDGVMAGQINKTGALTVRVSRPYHESSIAKVMDLVENATARKANTEKFITTFARYYTPAVVFIAVCVALVPPLFLAQASFQTWIYRALVLLVISCPCALVVSIPLGYFGGIGRASRSGILVKGSNYIDALAAIKSVVFDKTGTLTKGVFKVKETVSQNGYQQAKVLEFAAAAEYQSNHPIAVSIKEEFSRLGSKINPSQITEHTEITGKGVQVHYSGHTVLVGNDKILHRENILHDKCHFDSTVAHVAVDGTYAGYLIIGDEIRPDAHNAIKTLRFQGIEHVAMLTGDNICAAGAVSERLGLDQFHADLLPEDKVKIFEKIVADHPNHGKIAFVGDGINDAPVIARSDVGVAMGALGSDAAIETADVVLMTDSPMKMAEAVSIAKKTRRIVWQNISLVFVIKGVFIFLGAIGMATMWEAVFADMGTALLAVFNSTRVLKN
jgi:Cd2+/Zn2+-exporting ATPase